ncbi:MAG: hypothetical protein ABWZ74_00010 [Hyphomicrobiaceae bacterium]|jgi:hypothetical protein
MGLLQYVAVNEIRARGNIRDSDVLKLRKAFNEDASISVSEADALFELNDACTVKDPAWADFFIEAITDYVVNQAQPEGYIVADNAVWLMQRIAADGRVESHTELELLVHVLEKARWSPPSLARFALEQVKEAVLKGDGPLRAGQTLQPGAVSAAEVELLRRILFAFGGDGNIAITRSEADVLIDINKAISVGKSGTEFTDLFVKAVANAVLHGIGLAVPSREEALRAETQTETTDMRSAGSLLANTFAGGAAGTSARARVGGFLGGMLSSGASTIWGTYRLQSNEEQALAKLERQRLEIITGEKVEDVDAAWLADRLGRDGMLNQNERALLRFLKEESPALPTALSEMANRVGTAA